MSTSLSVLAALALLGAAGCDKLSGKKKPPEGGTAATGSGTAVPETGPIIVGHFASKTGSEATFGISTDQGVMMAVEERNAAGGVKGRQVKVVTLDTASKDSEGGTVVTRLINNEKAIALLGEVASSISIAGGKIAQSLGVPMVSPSSTNERVTKIGDMIFRVCFVDGFQGYVMAKFAYDDLKVTKVALMIDQKQAYSKGLADSFKAAFVKMGGSITTEQAYSGGDPDVSAQMQSIKTSGAQAIYMPGYYTDVGNMVRQARKLGIKEPFLGGDGWDSVKLTEIGGADIEGSYYSNHYSFEEQRPEVQEFVAKYQAKYSVVPDGLAALGYDAARVLFDAMDRAPSLSGKDIAAALAATKGFPGVTGIINIDANRDAQKKAVVLQVKNGKPAYVTSVSPPDAAGSELKPLVSPGAGGAAPAADDKPAAGGAPPPAAAPAAPAAPATAPKGAKPTEMNVTEDPDSGGQGK